MLGFWPLWATFAHDDQLLQYVVVRLDPMKGAAMTATIAAVLADAHAWDGHMGWGGGWWMLIFGTLMMAGFVVLVVVLARSLAPGAGAQGLGTDPTASARQILAERFARGELSATEYHERLDQLR